MKDGSESSYLRRRAREERDKAIVCEDNSVALAHLKMAEEYDRRAGDAAMRPEIPAQ